MLHHYNPSTLPCYQRCYLCAVKYPQPPKSKEQQAKLSRCQSLSRALKLMFFEAWHCAATCPILGPQEPAEFRVPPDSTSLLPASWKHTDCLKACRCSAANILVCKMKHLCKMNLMCWFFFEIRKIITHFQSHFEFNICSVPTKDMNSSKSRLLQSPICYPYQILATLPEKINYFYTQTID